MNKDNLSLIEEYLSFIFEIRGLAPSSIYTKKKHLMSFIEFISPKSVQDLRINEITAFVILLKNRDRGFHSRYHYQGNGKLSLMTVQNYMSTIRHFFKRCNSMGYTNKVDPSLIQSPKVRRKKIDALTDQELQAILMAPSMFEIREDVKLRNTLLIQVGYLMGLRRSEALKLTFENLLSKSKTILIHGKGKNQRKLYIPEVIQETAAKFQQLRRNQNEYDQSYTTSSGVTYVRCHPCKDLNPDIVFTCLDSNHYSMPLRGASTSLFFRKYEKALGLKKRITYHRLRHTFGRHLLNNNIDLYTIGQMLGHETIYATQHYITADSNKVEQAQKGLIGKFQYSLQLTNVSIGLFEGCVNYSQPDNQKSLADIGQAQFSDVAGHSKK